MDADRLTLHRGIAQDQRDALLIPLFAGTLFTSAALLFWIQPLFAKMTMPLLGGTPAVWTTAMVFFQAALLAAYGYAHFVSRSLALRAQFLVHAAVLALASVSLPLAVRWPFDPEGQPILQYLAVLLASIGLPFFAVAATAPLLQRWFSRTGHDSADDPYYLYGASNLGSVLALAAFPFVLEPSLRLAQQSVLWTMGYATLSVLILCCGYVAVQRAGADANAPPAAGAGGGAVDWRERGRWVLLAAVPSSLMLGVTTHISTDLAPIPLLWVAPLGLYLLTFVIAFSRHGERTLKIADLVAPYLIIPALMFGVIWAQVVGFSIAVSLALFFLLALICHGVLASLRPPVARLTEFYFLLSLGGVLGGLFNAIVAPLSFPGVWEYPIAIVLAVCLRPAKPDDGDRRERRRDFLLPLCLLLTAWPVVFFRWFESLGSYGMGVFWCLIGITGLLVFSAKDRPLRFGLATGALIAVLFSASSSLDGRTMARERSFFSVYRVAEVSDGAYRTLASGTTLHGVQATSPADSRLPLSYYSKDGPVGQIFAGMQRRRPIEQVGIIGLGAGASLCYALPGQRWAVFEIDPVVVALAQDARYFTYWSQCFDEERSYLRLGDARLTIRREQARSFDLLMVDAYNSDSVPVHLLTREALQLYLSKMRTQGVIALHISNRHLDLARVVAALAADAGLKGWIQHYTPGPDAHKKDQMSVWVALATPGQTLPFIESDPRWKPLAEVKAPVLWTDDYSNVVSILR